jgi:hypothetical protein
VTREAGENELFQALMRWVALAVVMMLMTAFRTLSPTAQPAVLLLDGVNNPAEGYQLLAQDPSEDLAADFAATGTTWADLTNLYVTTDTMHLWVYAELPNYNSASVGQFGLAIDTDGVGGSGGNTTPKSTGVTFAYTSTYNNVGSSPVITTNTLLPDIVIYGNLFSLSGETLPVGWTELNHWTGATWDDQDINWGGITTTANAIGVHVGFAYANGVELSIPFSDLGVAPTSTVHLEFFSIGRKVLGQPTGAADTVPADDQATGNNQPSTQRRLATINPNVVAATPHIAFSSASYFVSEAQDTAHITVTVAPTSTSLISVRFTTANGTAGLADYVAVSRVLTIGPGLAMQPVDLRIYPDGLAEADETVLLSLSQPVNGLLDLPDTATLTIHDSPPNVRIFLPLLRR